MKIGQILTTIVLLLVVTALAFSEIDIAMKVSTMMLVLIYWELVDISDKLG